MTKKIKTYEDLVQEERRLEAQAASYKLLIKDDFAALKEGLNPIKKATDTAKKFFTKSANGPMVNLGLNFSIDLLIRRMLLAKAAWPLRFFIPFVVKNITSHFLAEEDKGKVVGAVKNLINKIKRKQVPKKRDIAPLMTEAPTETEDQKQHF